MEVFIVDAVRTPVTAKNGALGEVHAADLAAAPLFALTQRNPTLSADAVVIGCASLIGEQASIATAAVLAAGWGESVMASAVDAGSNSGIRALLNAASLIASGQQQVVVAAAASSMTRVPNGATAGTAVGKPFGLSVHARFEEDGGLRPPGLIAEVMAAADDMSREDLDHYVMASTDALIEVGQSQWQSRVVSVELPLKGKLQRSVSVDDRLVTGRPLFAPADFVPSFETDGVITAGNSSAQADGAAAVLLASAEAVEANGWKPIARLIGSASSGSPMLTGASGADVFTKAIAATAVGANVEVFVHEDFAVTPLAFQNETGIKVNRSGGVLGLGDPLGAGTLITFVNAIAAMNGPMAIVCAGATNQQDCAVIAP